MRCGMATGLENTSPAAERLLPPGPRLVKWPKGKERDERKQICTIINEKLIVDSRRRREFQVRYVVEIGRWCLVVVPTGYYHLDFGIRIRQRAVGSDGQKNGDVIP